MPNPPYSDLADCHELIRQYAERLETATDAHHADKRDPQSTTRYMQDLRWYNDWLAEEDITDPQDLSRRDADRLGHHLGQEFNGSTGLNRWNIIKRLYNWLAAVQVVEENHLLAFDDIKGEEMGLTNSTEQRRHLDDEEFYAPTREEIRLYEEYAGTQHRTRNQTIIRMLFQTMMRPGELAKIRLADLDRDAREIDIRAKIAKNDERRVVAYQPSLDGLLYKYLDTIRPDRIQGKDHDRVFVGERGGRMTYNAVSDVVRNAASRADDAHPDRDLQDDEMYTTADGQSRARVTGHSPRHAGATHVAHNTDMGVFKLSKALGHSSVEITERMYVENPPTAPTEAMHKHGPE